MALPFDCFIPGQLRCVINVCHDNRFDRITKSCDCFSFKCVSGATLRAYSYGKCGEIPRRGRLKRGKLRCRAVEASGGRVGSTWVSRDVNQRPFKNNLRAK